jgi:hypothetical protein
MQHNGCITNDGLKVLTHLPKLKELNLWYCGNIDDSGVSYLAKIKTLRVLNRGGTKISDVGVAQLREALPDCKIDR